MATIVDIASLAGVSIATASRAINGKSGVRPKTRKRILDAARDLNYIPNQVAISMKKKQTKMIGFIVADMANHFYSYVTKIIEKQAHNYNYSLLVFNTDDNVKALKEAINILTQRRVDGIILGCVRMIDRSVTRLIQSGLPCIMFHRHLKNREGFFVGCDNQKGMEVVVRHLVELEHERIALISGPRYISSGLERLKGFMRAMKKHNKVVYPELIGEGGYKKKKTITATRQLLNLPTPPTAIVAASDLMALQVMDYVVSQGMRVPEDLSIVGFDDIPMAAHSRIQLTTVAVQAKKSALLAVDTLINIIEGVKDQKVPKKYLFDPVLMNRNSTAPPKP